VDIHHRVREASLQVAEVDRIDQAQNLLALGKTAVTAIQATQRQWGDSLDLERKAVALCRRAERRIGQLIKRGQERGEIATRNRHPGSVGADDTAPATLDELGLTRDESSQFTKLALIPDEDFEEALVNDLATAPTRKALLNLFFVNQKNRTPGSHPAKFSDEIMEIMVECIRGYERVLDPFAGTGRIHEIADAAGVESVGVELEPEWAKMHKRTRVGNALQLDFDDGSFDCLCTSPCYGNRLADHHDAKDDSVRHSYTHDLGRPLSPGNAGVLQWGEDYRDFHEQAWKESRRVLTPGARAVINISDHIRDGERMPVTAWHLDYWSRIVGARLYDIVPVDTKRLRYGANTDRPLIEYVLVFDIME
jgi:hypothetical protein